MSAAAYQTLGTPLETLLQGIVRSDAVAAAHVTGLALDSRRVTAGSAFAAIPGTRQHGLVHVADAVAAGAAAVLYEPEGACDLAEARASCDAAGIPLVPVPRLAAYAGELAARIHGHPAAGLHCIGVTGTDGKTSVTRFLADALDRGDARCGLVGTLGAGFPDHLIDTGMTTPDAAMLQERLRGMVDQGARSVVMEASSHALIQERLAGIPFHTAVLTNLGRDHLDYHGGAEAYAQAKMRLFRGRHLQLVVLNQDDALGLRLRRELRGVGPRVLSYSLDAGADVELLCTSLRTRAEGLAMTAITPAGTLDVSVPLLGRFNAANILAVIGVLHGLGLDTDVISQQLQRVRPVPGRMEPFSAAGRALAVVDYAHTAGALSAALSALRQHARGRVWCVFGCGGERDTGKRPLMGRAAEALADEIIITDDNPRGEDPDAIVSAIRDGLRAPGGARIIRDRAAAIATALSEAAADDVVLVAGKGHETDQITATGRHHFSDREVVERIQTGGEP